MAKVMIHKLANSGAQIMFNKILVALDNTAMSARILDEALVLAKQLQAHLMLLHVLSPLDPNHFGVQPGGIGIEGFYPILNEQAVNQYMKEWQTYEEQGIAQLQGYARSAAADGLTAEFTQNIGDPGHTICQVAATWGANLILMGRNRKSGLTEMFLGSTSNYVLHHAPCSVLAVQSASKNQTPEIANDSAGVHEVSLPEHQDLQPASQPTSPAASK
jgi:nucleotide-binding universal stress UspA family protein